MADREDFDAFYTVEFKGPKGWEVGKKSLNYHDAIAYFWEIVNEGLYQVRFTSPKPLDRGNK